MIRVLAGAGQGSRKVQDVGTPPVQAVVRSIPVGHAHRSIYVSKGPLKHDDKEAALSSSDAQPRRFGQRCSPRSASPKSLTDDLRC